MAQAAQDILRSIGHPVCAAVGCDKPRKGRDKYCSMHQARLSRHGDLRSRSERQVSNGQVKLTRGFIALIDQEAESQVNQYTWHATAHGYAATRNLNGEFIYMHRLLMNPGADQEVDHINGNKLDNRHSNLRLCTSAQNGWNRPSQGNSRTSKFKGVCFDRSKRRWLTQLRSGQVKISRRFKTEIEAARYYNEIARQHHGEFAVLNDV